MSDGCNSLRRFIREQVRDYLDEHHTIPPTPLERVVIGTPHWDNNSIPNSTRIFNRPQGVEFNVSSWLNPDTGLLEGLPGSRIVLNDVVPMYTPVDNIENLSLTFKNLSNVATRATVRLETVRRVEQGFANYVTLVNQVNLNPQQEVTENVLTTSWWATRDILDTGGTVVLPRSTPASLTTLNNLLSVEELFNYPIDQVPNRQSYPGVITEEAPLFHEIFAFSVGEQDTSIVSNPVTVNYLLKNISWKVGGVQTIKAKVKV